MGALKWCLLALAICSSAHRLTPTAGIPIPPPIQAQGPTPAPFGSGPIPTPLSVARPVGSGPTPAITPDFPADELHRVYAPEPPPDDEDIAPDELHRVTAPPKDEEIASEPLPPRRPSVANSAAALNCGGVPKNSYYCQPAGCGSSTGKGCGGGGFTIYFNLGDQFPSASGDHSERKS